MNGRNPIAYGLPHREPFLFIGSVVEVRPGEAAVCEKAFSPEEPFFLGHFPGDPLVPGVIIAEALAQTAGIAAGQSGRGFRLTAIKGMKFLRPVRPCDLLTLHARKLAAVGGLWQFAVSARVGEDTVADGVVVLNEV